MTENLFLMCLSHLCLTNESFTWRHGLISMTEELQMFLKERLSASHIVGV